MTMLMEMMKITIITAMITVILWSEGYFCCTVLSKK